MREGLLKPLDPNLKYTIAAASGIAISLFVKPTKAGDGNFTSCGGDMEEICLRLSVFRVVDSKIAPALSSAAEHPRQRMKRANQSHRHQAPASSQQNRPNSFWHLTLAERVTYAEHFCSAHGWKSQALMNLKGDLTLTRFVKRFVKSYIYIGSERSWHRKRLRVAAVIGRACGLEQLPPGSEHRPCSALARSAFPFLSSLFNTDQGSPGTEPFAHTARSQAHTS
jgi:hypothetical protein